MAELPRRRQRPRMDEIEAAMLNSSFGNTQGRTPRAAIERALERDL